MTVKLFSVDVGGLQHQIPPRQVCEVHVWAAQGAYSDGSWHGGRVTKLLPALETLGGFVRACTGKIEHVLFI